MKTEAALPVEAPRLTALSIDSITASPHNPRHFALHDAKDLELVSLAESIAELGVMQPVIVRQLEPGKYELVAGERRFRASKLAKQETIPAVVRVLTDREAIEFTVTENLQRKDLHPLEEARGVASLIAAGETIDQAADRLGKPRSWVARRARLVNLSPAWRKRAEDRDSGISEWSAAALELVARLEQPAQDALLKAKPWIEHRGSVGDLRGLLAEYTRDISLAPWKADDALLLPAAGACSSCPKRSSHHPGLFDDELDRDGKKVQAGDRCLDATCWAKKAAITLDYEYRELRAKHPDLKLGGNQHDGKVPDFAASAKLVSSYNGTAAKQGEKGAVPVLFVNGDQAGKLRWMIFHDGTPKTAGATPKKKTMAEKRGELEGRRQAHALDGTLKAIAAAAPPPTPVLLQLLVAYGTISNRSNPGMDSYDNAGGKPLSLIEKGQGDDAYKSKRLWESVAKVIRERWDRTKRWQGTKGMKLLLPEIACVCRLVRVDQAPFAAAAVKALPEPKSWSKPAPKKKSPASRAKTEPKKPVQPAQKKDKAPASRAKPKK